MLEQFWLIEKLTNLLTFRILWTNIFAMAPLFQKPPNCHFPSLSPTIEGDGGQQRKKMKIWDICAGNQNLGPLCWNGAKLPFSFTLAQPLRRCWSSALSLPPKEKQYSFFYCPAVHTLLILPRTGKNTLLEKDGTVCATFPNAKWLMQWLRSFWFSSHLGFQILIRSDPPMICWERSDWNWNLTNCWTGNRPPMNGSHLATDSVRVEQEQQELVDWTTFCIEGVLLPVLAIFGILGEYCPSLQYFGL